jgi:hypothetical protein
VINLLAAEPLIIARLKAQAPALKTVGSASLLAGAQDVAPYCPAAFVMPGAGDYGERHNQARIQAETQHWEVVVCVAHIRDPDDEDTTALAAGALLRDIVVALIGWKPSTDFRALTLVERPAPFYDVGYAEFPLIFETRLLVFS